MRRATLGAILVITIAIAAVLCVSAATPGDEAGRLYRGAGTPGGPEGNRLEGSLGIAPPIPADVRRLTVTVGTLLDASGEQPIPGPWVFPIRLPAPTNA